MSSKDNIIITEDSSSSEQVFRGRDEIDQYLYLKNLGTSMVTFVYCIFGFLLSL